MNRKIAVVLTALTIGVLKQTYSQTNSQLTLRVGDTIPESIWHHPLSALDARQNGKNLSLSGYEGKWVILDFWATWCTPCVAMMPKLDSLQRHFQGKVQFLPVTYQKEQEVATFLIEYSKNPIRQNSLPKVVNDTVLRHLFPHTILPHYIWIGPDRVVKAITDSEAVSADTIAAMMRDDWVSLAVKQEPIEVPFKPEKPLLVNGNGGDGAGLMYQSALSRYIPGVRGGFSIRPPDDSGIRQLSFANVGLNWFYRKAYGADSIIFGSNRMELNLEEPCEFRYTDSCGRYEDWLLANAYTYQLFSAAKDRDAMFRMVAEDLRRLFPMYEATIEKRRKTCWVMSRTDSSVVLTADPTKPHKAGMGAVKGIGYTLQNALLKGFIQNMNMFPLQDSPYPLIDDTRITERIDLQIDANLSDMEAVSQSLEKYGLKITLEERNIDVLVIRDLPGR